MTNREKLRKAILLTYDISDKLDEIIARFESNQGNIEDTKDFEQMLEWLKDYRNLLREQ